MMSINRISNLSGTSAIDPGSGKVNLWTPVFIWLLAVGVRWSHIVLLADYDPAFEHQIMDARWHVEWARALAMGMWEPEPFFRAPLYPFFLGALFKIFGIGFLAPRLAQGALGALTCVLIWALGKKLAGPRVGSVAGIIAALYGPLVYFDSEFLIPALFLPLVIASLLLLMRARETLNNGRSSRVMWGVAGFIAGLAAIARPNMLILVPGIFVWVAWEIPGWRRKLLAFAVWLVFFTLPVVGVTTYNAVEGGGFVPIASQGGVNFWIGNNRMADGKTAMAPAYHGSSSKVASEYRDSVQVNARLEAEKRLGRNLRSDWVSAYWFGQAIRFIRNEPAAWLKLTVKKIFFITNGYELPSNREIYQVRRWSPILGILLWERPLAFPFGLLLPLALAGMFLAWRNSEVNGSVERLLLIYILVYSAGVVVFFVTARHRLPLVPALIPFAALTLASLPGGLKNIGARHMSRPGMAALAMIAFALGISVSNAENFDIRKVPRREHHMNMGYVFTEEKRYAEALQEYRAALEEEPRFIRARFDIGVVYLMMGRHEDARSAFIEILKIAPRYTEVWVHLGNVYFEENKYSEAIASYRKAIAINPRHTLAHYNLAITYSRKGDFENYTEELILANRSDPNFAPANIDIARLFMSQGLYERARVYIERAMRITPNDPRLKKLLDSMPR